jgi:hypothetical protein
MTRICLITLPLDFGVDCHLRAKRVIFEVFLAKVFFLFVFHFVTKGLYCILLSKFLLFSTFCNL